VMLIFLAIAYVIVGVFFVVRDFSMSFINAPLYIRKVNLVMILCLIFFWPIRFFRVISKKQAKYGRLKKEQTVTSSSQSALNYYNKGTVSLRMNRFGDALEAFNKAIDEDPNFVSAYINRANTYSRWRPLPSDMAKIRELEDFAMRDYAKAIELDANNAHAYYNRAVAYYVLGKYSESWRDVFKAESLGMQLEERFLWNLESFCPRSK